MNEATPLPDAPLKQCFRCREIKSLGEFHKRRAAKDGRNSWCKECHRAWRRAKPGGTCSVDGCARATSGGQPKCTTCYRGGPPLALGLRTRGMPRHDAHGNRLCSHCLGYLPPSEFGKHNRVSDGISRVCRSCTRAAVVQRKYGITIQQAEQMWTSPCTVCGFFEAGTMVIDHCHNSGGVRGTLCHPCNCHNSGGVRGTLCHPCNVSIGHFNDDPELLEKAAQYLRSFTGAQASQDRPQQPEEPHAPRSRGWSTRKSRKSTCP